MALKETLFKFLMNFGIYPHIRFTYSPFKIIEFEAIMNRIQLTGNEKALDIGCGDGLHTMLIAKRVGHVIGIDIDESFIARAKSYGEKFQSKASTEYIASSLEKIKFPDNTFDVVFSICVIEHIENYEEVLAECRRVLKPGGRIIFTVDTLELIDDPALIAKHKKQHWVQQYFRRDTLGALLEKNGFTSIQFEQLFRSPLAKKHFVDGINHGFNFGRFRCVSIANEMRKQEEQIDINAPGMFLLADAVSP